MTKGPVAALLRKALGLPSGPADQVDDAYRVMLNKVIQTPRLDGGCLLAFDGVYDAQGRLDLGRTSVMVGNDYCLEVCRDSPKFFPICSVNPARRDAIDELERVVELGSVAIKTLPNSQGFDPADKAYTAFFQRMADLGTPWLTHTSFEHTIPPLNQLYGKPERLRLALEQGVTVIAAHCAGSGVAHPFREDFQTWRMMLRDHDNLWGDISAMASVSRFPYIHKVLQDPLARQRVLMGSDFPVPVSPAVFVRQLGVAKVRELSQITNPLARNVRVFEALGVPQEVFERTAKLLRLAPVEASV